MILSIISTILFIISIPLDVARMALTARRLAVKAAKIAGKVANKTVGKAAGKAASKAGVKKPAIMKSKSVKAATKLAGKAAEFALRRLEDALRLIVILLRCSTGIFAVIAFFVMLFMLVLLLVLVGGVAGYVAMSDGNLGGSGGSRRGGSTGGAANIGQSGATDMEGVVKLLGNWLITDVKKYYHSPASKDYHTTQYWWDCPLLDEAFGGEGKGHMRPDCTGLAAAVVQYAFNDGNVPVLDSGDMVKPNGTFATYVKEKGYADVFVVSTDNVNVTDLRPGDMLVYRGQKSGHAEFYISPTQQFGWGAVQTQYPIENHGWTRCGTYIANDPSGGGHAYTTWYRWKDITHKASGGSSSSSSDDSEEEEEDDDSE